MNKLKLVFALGTVLLAGATAFATKAQRQVNVHYAPGSGCPQTTREIACSNLTSQHCLGTHGSSLGQTLYTDGCQNSLHTNG